MRFEMVGHAALAVMVGALLQVPPAAGQTAAALDPRWTPWLGCWRLLKPTPGDVLVCVDPDSGGTGIVSTTLADRSPVLMRKLVADGSSHPVDESDCRGTERVEWSRDGRRLFTRAEVDCKGGERRVVSGLSLMAATLNGPAWLDVQSTAVRGTEQVYVRRYLPALDPRGVGETPPESAARRTPVAQLAAAAPIDIDGVIEASSRLPSQAVEATLLEAAPQFKLDRHSLVRLADGGVAGSVIDLMVGLSFPERFRAERRRPQGGGVYGFANYSPFGYSYWWDPSTWWWDPSADVYYLGGGFMTFGPIGGHGDRNGGGRAIQGLGYTRVTARTGGGSGSSRGTSSSGGGAQHGNSSGSGSSSGSSSSGSSSSGSSASGSSSSGGSARTAQPR